MWIVPVDCRLRLTRVITGQPMPTPALSKPTPRTANPVGPEGPRSSEIDLGVITRHPIPPPHPPHCARPALPAARMSAPPSPSGSETSTIGFLANETAIDDLLVELGGGSPLSVVGAPNPRVAQGLAESAAASWLEALNSGGPMPGRAELIGLLSGLLHAQTAPVLAMPARAAPSDGLDEVGIALETRTLTRTLTLAVTLALTRTRSAWCWTPTR